MRTYGRGWLERLRKLGALALCNAAIFIVAVWVFAAIADEVREGETFEAEDRIMRSLRSGEPPVPVGPLWLVEVARDITGLGSVAVLSSMVLLVAGFLAFSRRYAAAAFVMVASGGGLLLNTTLKNLFDRERPDETLRLIEIHSHSFPSGHAMSSATIYLTLAVLLTRLVTLRREKLYVLGAALLVSFLVGLSRVYLGVHYPTDVIAGWAAGVAWAQVCWFAVHVIGRRRLAHEAARP
ncbi:MAG TPA: phosphatase PAP2 family protein [Opitutus sp.]|nr:phosphatase PAP2 family protein [Opitutus sp.]